MNWKGNWSSATTYAINDGVFDSTSGSSYIAIAANTNQQPPNATYWNLLAQKGANGSGSGTVSSVALTAPAFLSVSGSPITSTGTLALSYSGTALPVANGGTGVTTSTGSGNVVLSTGPSLGSATVSDYETFTSVAAPTYTEGRIWYDSTQKALTYNSDISGNALHVGQETQLKVRNSTGATIAKGAPVYITSTSTGVSFPNVALAKADTLVTGNCIGLANEAIANGADGYVVINGILNGVNTGTFTVGDILYVSPYSAGQLMNTYPPTGYPVRIGVVSYVNSSTGSIYINQSNSFVQASSVVGAVAIANGGTGQTTAAAAITALAGTQTSGYYLRSNGTNTLLAAIQAADVPTLNQNTTGTAANVTGTVAIANGGTGSTTASAALTALGAYPASNPSGYGTGTVTSVAALTLGTTGTDVSSTVANGTTTPVITLNLPSSSATNRGLLTAADWTTFNNKGSGTVTSVSFTGGVVSVATGTTTPAFTVAGTSGGIPYFSSASTWATSAALAANALVIGGGAGVAPSTTTTATGALTFLGTPTSANLAALLTDETGTGANVFATSPTLVTPILGTPTSGTLSNCTVDGTNSVGYLNIPQNSQSAAYTLVLSDAGKHIYHPTTDANARTYTIPANSSVAYPIGTAISFINMTSQVVTIAITTDTMYLSSAGTTGSRSLSQYGTATAVKITSTSWIISGSGLT